MKRESTGRPLAVGRQVLLRSPAAQDEDAFLAAVRASKKLHRPWSAPPWTHQKFVAMLKRNETDEYDALLVVTRDEGRIAGCANLQAIIRGSLHGCFLGYWGVAGFEGCGLMTEGVDLALRHAFRTLKLHRVEANIQPGNDRSLLLVRRLGFRREGFSPRYVKILGRWRDHERWAITREEWKPRAARG